MAKKKTEELFKAWAEDAERKVPEDQREQFRQFVNSETGQVLFSGYMKEADYYSRLNEVADERKVLESEKNVVNKRKDELQKWYEDNAPLYEQTVNELKRTKASKDLLESKYRELTGEEPESSTKKESSMSVFDNKELESLRSKVTAMDAILPQFMGQMFSITKRALKDGYEVDPMDVIKFSAEKGVDPETAFLSLTYDQRKAREDKDLEKKLADAKEAGKREALSNLSNPDSVRQSGPTIFDTLQTQPTDSRSRVDRAVASFLEATK